MRFFHFNDERLTIKLDLYKYLSAHAAVTEPTYFASSSLLSRWSALSSEIKLLGVSGQLVNMSRIINACKTGFKGIY